MRNILRLRVLGILMLALGLFGGSVSGVAAQDDDATPIAGYGTITISAFLSEAVALPVLVGPDTVSAAEEAVPADVDFALYLQGSGSPLATGNTSNGAVVIDDLPYDVYVLTFSWSDSRFGPISYIVDLSSGDSAYLTLLVPTGDTPGVTDSACIVLSSFAAENVDSPAVFFVSDPIVLGPNGGVEDVNAVLGSADYDIPYTGAYVVDRSFTLLLSGQSTQFNRSIQTNGGVATICDLPNGEHTLVDTQTGIGVDVTVAEGYVTSVVAVFPEGFGDTGNPGDPDTEAPGAGTTAGDSDDDGDSDGDGSTSGGSVSKLPSTGQGSSTESSTIVMILGAMSLVALAGGFAWRQRRSA